MHRLWILISLAAIGCGPKPYDPFPTVPLGELVGSWRATHAFSGEYTEAARSDLDIYKEGNFVEAWYDGDGKVLCTRTGQVQRLPNDVVWFKPDQGKASNSCDWYWYDTSPNDPDEFSFSTQLLTLTADGFEYQLDGEALVSYQRQAGPLVTADLMGVKNWYENDYAGPPPDAAPEEDPRVTYVARRANDLAKEVYAGEVDQLEGFVRLAVGTAAQSDDEVVTVGGAIADADGWLSNDGTHAEGSWTSFLHLDAGFTYVFTILVGTAASDPTADVRTLGDDGAFSRVTAMARETVGDLYVLRHMVSYVGANVEAGKANVKVIFGDGATTDEPSILVLFQKRDP